ncbi:hypothetical protein ALC53_07815 [Atta colombica]|uniref:Uncharacterized protein n=1 Tax=Atta colombica TaxID=520822 RepID=A0A195BB92_9HYME|nr:hypothetical protein ALC53_07815 [Atta colombica]
MQQNLKSFSPPPPAIPKGESDLRARGLKSGYLRYQAFDAETGVTTSAARHEKRRGEARRGKARRGGAKRDEARRGEERRGKETRSRDNSRVNLPRVTVALARTRISDKCVPVRAPISRGLVGDTRARTDRISSRIPARFSPRDRSAEKDSKSERKRKREKERGVLLSIIIAVPAHV